MDDHPPVKLSALFIHIVGRLDALDTRMEEHDQEAHRREDSFRRAMRKSDYWRMASTLFKWFWLLFTQLSTVFIASYVAFEHSSYVEKVASFLHRLIGLMP